MHSIEIHEVINKIISFFYRIGFWHQGDQPTAKEIRLKTFYCIYYALFSVLSAVGAITSDNEDEYIFLAEVSIAVLVLSVKLSFLIWKQKEILDLLNRVCVFSIRYDEDFKFFNDKLQKFMRFVIVFLFGAVTVYIGTGVLPFVGKEKTLFIKIAFPLDWENNDIAFWIANAFIFTENFLSVAALLLTVTIWYLMVNCSLRYEVLGGELTKIGQIDKAMKKQMTEKEKHNIYFQDLKASIDVHVHLKEMIDKVENVCANLFFLQIATSGLCICGSICCLAFNVSDNLVERMIYLYTLFFNISEIFMITYFGNEIMLSSNRLSYRLFESDWIDQPQSTKNCIIVFGEYLKQPYQFLVGKIYPLTLELFTKILKSAYSMFNIFKTLKK